MKCLWEIEHEQSGLKAVVSAPSHNAMVDGLKSRGFKSPLTKEAQKTCVIDLMIAVRDDGAQFSAMEYVRPETIVRELSILPHIDSFPAPEGSQ